MNMPGTQLSAADFAVRNCDVSNYTSTQKLDRTHNRYLVPHPWQVEPFVQSPRQSSCWNSREIWHFNFLLLSVLWLLISLPIVSLHLSMTCSRNSVQYVVHFHRLLTRNANSITRSRNIQTLSLTPRYPTFPSFLLSYVRIRSRNGCVLYKVQKSSHHNSMYEIVSNFCPRVLIC